MEEYKRDELETRSTADLEQRRDLLMAKLEARQSIHREIEAMVGEGKAHFMTDEECALVHNFRRFKAGLSKDKRGTFTFRTWADVRDIVPGDEVSLVRAPETE